MATGKVVADRASGNRHSSAAVIDSTRDGGGVERRALGGRAAYERSLDNAAVRSESPISQKLLSRTPGESMLRPKRGSRRVRRSDSRVENQGSMP